MRSVIGILVCLGVGAISLALADPSNTQDTSAAPAAAPAAATPAASASAPAAAPQATAAAAATPATQDKDEKRLLAMGYRAKIRNGVKVFCRSDDVIGSRLAQVEHCGTVADLKAAQNATREDAEDLRRQSLRVVPVGK